jgi:hypothetical protein
MFLDGFRMEQCFLCLPADPPSIRLKRTLSGAVFDFSNQWSEDRVRQNPNSSGGGENNHETTDFSWHCMTHSLALATKSLPFRHQNMASIHFKLRSDSQASAARLRVG